MKPIKIYEDANKEEQECAREFNGTFESGTPTTWICTRGKHNNKTPHQWVSAQRSQNRNEQRPNGVYTEVKQ